MRGVRGVLRNVYDRGSRGVHSTRTTGRGQVGQKAQVGQN